MIVGDGTLAGVEMGPIQNEAQFERLRTLLEQSAVDEKVIAGGTSVPGPGYFIRPTIVRDIADDAVLVREEQFGPILPVLRYTSIDDAVVRANASRFGLGSSVWGRDLERATKVATRINAGTVWVNKHMEIDPAIPFRGARQSGWGGEMGREGLHEYTQAHIVNISPIAD